MNVEALARQLYDACQTNKPSWDQLGEVTKSVWRERAQAQLTAAAPEPASPGPASASAPVEQPSLF